MSREAMTLALEVIKHFQMNSHVIVPHEREAIAALRAALEPVQPVACGNCLRPFDEHTSWCPPPHTTEWRHPAPPAGYVMVPVEPTEEMVLEGRRALRDNGAEGSDFELQDDAVICYNAMLSAAKKGGE